MKRVPEHTTAILVFANSSEHEAIRKPFGKGEPFFNALNQRTLEIVQASGLPYFRFTEHEQYGASFKERFVNALSEVFEKGYENVIALGNDTPHLSSGDIHFACNQLKNNKLVIGPSADGGIYLIGLNRSDFSVNEFLELPWQSHDLARAVVQIASVQEKVVLLKTLFDLDTQADLKRFFARFRNFGRQLHAAITTLLSVKKESPQHLIFSYRTAYSHILYNKGSPLL